jgi:hypothetical protein
MPNLRAWLVVVPLSTLGALGGHRAAYALTGTGGGELHGYLHHAPQVVLLLLVLSLLGAALVERGARVVLWPFPVVVMLAFVLQEHVERLSHTGSFPLLLDQPVFLVGIALQAIVALAAWLVARLLVRALGHAGTRPLLLRPVRELVAPPITEAFRPVRAGLLGSCRAPPLRG